MDLSFVFFFFVVECPRDHKGIFDVWCLLSSPPSLSLSFFVLLIFHVFPLLCLCGYLFHSVSLSVICIRQNRRDWGMLNFFTFLSWEWRAWACGWCSMVVDWCVCSLHMCVWIFVGGCCYIQVVYPCVICWISRSFSVCLCISNTHTHTIVHFCMRRHTRSGLWHNSL